MSHPYGDEYYTVSTNAEAPNNVAYRTKAEALRAAQNLRNDFPEIQIHVAIVRYGQGCAISTDEWWPFPDTAPDPAPADDDAPLGLTCLTCGRTIGIDDARAN